MWATETGGVPSARRPPEGTAAETPERPRSLLRDVAVFLLVGGVTTLAYGAIYVVLREILSAPVANALAFLATAAVNTAGHRHFTFQIRRWEHGWRQQLENGALLTLGVVITSGALMALDALVTEPSPAAEATVLVLANVVAAMLHFLLLRSWVFRSDRL